MSVLGRMLVTCFGLGYLRPAPGTWGSLPPVLLTITLICVLGSDVLTVADLLLINTVLVLVGTLFAAACFRYGAPAESLWNRKDPSQVVADEVAGQCVALMFLPWVSMQQPDGARWNGLLAAVAFIVFRLMDIIKPPPARAWQRFNGGKGIVIDDLIAGCYALILTQLAAHFARTWLLAAR